MDNNQTTIFVGNLPFSTTEDELRDIFSAFGAIVKVHIPTNRETGQPRGFAFVEFETEEATQESLAVDGQELNGRSMKVSIALGKKDAGSRPPRNGGGGNRFGGGDRNGGGFSRDRNRRF